MRRVLIWILRLTVLGLCVGYALWGVDFSQLGLALIQYSPWRLAGVLAISVLAYLALAGRLAVLLRGVPGAPAIRTTLLASLFALGMNNLLPARLGEIAKVVYLRQRCGASSGWLMGAVFWERFADIHALLALSIATVVAIGPTQAFVPMAAAVALGWAALLWIRFHPRPFAWAIDRLPGSALSRFGHDILNFLRKGLGLRLSAELIAWTTVLWLFYALHVYLVVVWVAGIDLTLPQVLTVFLGVSLGMAVPVSPGALGIYEAITVLVLGWYGVPTETALAAGLTAHMLQYIPTTLVGAGVLSRTDVSLRSLTAARRDSSPEPSPADD